jgi:microcystin-dependent protein
MALSEIERRKLGQRAPAQLLEATVLNPPLDAKGLLRVELDNAPGQALPPCPWKPRPDLAVAPGDAAAVLQSDIGNYWVVEWWSQSGVTPSIVGGGTDWFSLDAEPPDPALGDVGDLALVSTSGNYYEKVASGLWELRGSLRGPTGPAGPQGLPGTAGATGPEGPEGPSAYEVWLAAGNVGDVDAYLLALKGATGATGPEGPAGPEGPEGPEGPQGAESVPDPLVLDTWHVIGAAGQPAYGSGYTAYAGFISPAFRKDPFGRVHLRGLVNGYVASGAIFTLPVGYRPTGTLLLDTISNNAVGRLDINANGIVSPSAGASWISLDGLYFDTDAVAQLDAFTGPQGPPGVGAAITGSVLAYAGSAAPPGFLLCQGQLVDRTTYADLYAIAGHVFNGGVDPGANQFRLPDLKGRPPIGVGTGDAAGATLKALGAKYGEETHLSLAAESGVPDHTHASAAPPSSANTWQASNVATNVFVIQVLNTGTGGVSGGAKNATARHNTLGPTLGMNYIVKT